MNPMWNIVPMWTPFLPTNCSKPPTLYSLMQSMVNYDAEERTTTRNLAKQCHEEIFDFEYPLSDNVNKEEFECLILNHFIMRRIGYETFTAFQIALEVKMNEIMPNYNFLFDAMDDWTLFGKNQVTTRNVTDTRTTSSTNASTTGLTNSTTDSNTSDRRFSATPNNSIADVQSGTYVTEYNYDQNSGNASSTSSGTASGSASTTDGGTLTERVEKTNDDSKMIDIYIKFTQRKKNIYSMIFKDLDVLFYQLD